MKTMNISGFCLVIFSIWLADANELTRCCAGGGRHYRETTSCNNVKAVGTSAICTRAASICCLRTLTDASCVAGTEHATQHHQCSSININDLAGVTKRECCDCCALAQDLVSRGDSCVAANGFSSSCLSSFQKCCSSVNQNQNSAHRNFGESYGTSVVTSHPMFDSCDGTRCEHLCTVRSDGDAECSCRPGYDLSSDGYSCIDVDECLLLIGDCLESQRCLNTPGSYKCIRTLSCGTGYAMDSETEQCVDVDECNLGSHDCGPQYQCRNTQGSYRCHPKECSSTDVLNPSTGECTSVNCPQGYVPGQNGKCEDLDECLNPNRCGPFEECINIPGSYRCQEKGNLCLPGYTLDRETGFCADRNECVEGATCSLHATCENTIGSFKCHCKTGFQLSADGRTCDDVDECTMGIANCQQKCINVPGSYQCICNRGYQLSIDETTCEDIDECSTWAKSGNPLCMGSCINTIGSFICTCPPGYELQSDGITCKDIDECTSLIPPCHGNDRQLCVNTLGSYKCQTIECPRNYIPDRHYKNRCVRKPHLCETLTLERCKNYALHISWQHIAIPKQVNISSQRTTVTLFSMKGPTNLNSTMQFELRLVDAKPEDPNVVPASRSNFLLQKGVEHNSAIIALRDSLDGPQEVQLELMLRLTTNGSFVGKYVANLIIFVRIDDGYSCLKQCQVYDHKCLANYTQEILYQFRAVYSSKAFTIPIEISRITSKVEPRYSVEYTIDRTKTNVVNFMVEQEGNIGVIKLKRALKGPMITYIHVLINIRSSSQVLVTRNIAIIQVNVSHNPFYSSNKSST
ncbi:calcium-binding EGF domain-containing protein [Ditylenchus destructor]|uniref:Fibulin-1 n=1 Tax=Ditylenchus destructor TaxID=166010 RepID=A0AAD4NE70_9BILA|nr:calcium-binding EGF domain-containing protein [Ditylenchus destructor]